MLNPPWLVRLLLNVWRGGSLMSAAGVDVGCSLISGRDGGVSYLTDLAFILLPAQLRASVGAHLNYSLLLPPSWRLTPTRKRR